MEVLSAKRDQPACGSPDFDGCEVDGCQDIPAGLEKRGPRRLPFAIERRFDAVLFRDVAGYRTSALSTLNLRVGDSILCG